MCGGATISDFIPRPLISEIVIDLDDDFEADFGEFRDDFDIDVDKY